MRNLLLLAALALPAFFVGASAAPYFNEVNDDAKPTTVLVITSVAPALSSATPQASAEINSATRTSPNVVYVTVTQTVNVQNDAACGESSGKQLWVSTPGTTSIAVSATRLPQPPSGVDTPSGKDRPSGEQGGSIPDFYTQVSSPDSPEESSLMHSLDSSSSGVERDSRAILAPLDPHQQSPLDTNQRLLYRNTDNSYAPNTKLFDQSMLKRPFQTNRWWQNLVVESGIDPIHVYPYMIKCLGNSSVVGFPKFQASETAMTSSQSPDWTLGDANGRLSQRLVTGYDDLGVYVGWSGSGSTTMRSRFFKGMPFVTYEMAGMAPSLSTIHAVLKTELLSHSIGSNGVRTFKEISRLTGTMVDLPGLTKITLNDNSKWLVVSKPAITWQQSGNSLKGPDNYNGIVQMAHLGDNPDDNVNILQKYAGTYATEGTVTYTKIQDKQTVGRSSDLVFFYKTNSDEGGSTDRIRSTNETSTQLELLSFMLPHHMDSLNTTAVTKENLSGYRCAKGLLTAIVGNMIIVHQPLEPVDYEGQNQMTSADQGMIKQQLAIDAGTAINVTAPDPYFFGKGLSRVARLYQIAQEVQDTATSDRLRDQMVKLMTPWLISFNNEDPLVYDQTWGGIVSTKGLSDPGADFGQGRYNDHHFHYGYFLYAGAILAKHDPSAFAPFKEPLNQLLRDYANPTYKDDYFPYMRHFDPYDGHSWAAGLFTFADGRNQESTGEAVNAYYGAYLYAKSLGLSDVADFYEIVLNIEATSGRRYWHPTLAQARAQYISPFTHNAVGILWSGKADFATFFGADSEFIFGIQMIPFTPATRMLLQPDWVKEAWCPDGSSCAGGMKPAAEHANKNGWAQFLYTALSVVDRSTALANVKTCTPDDGNTLTNVLHWIATSGQQSSAGSTVRR